MSGNGIRSNGAQYDPLERWYTPASVVDRHVAEVLHMIDYHPGDNVTFFDPTAGDGRYGRSLLRAGVSQSWLVETDISPGHERVTPLGFEDAIAGVAASHEVAPSVLITNPPFSHAVDIVERALGAGVSCVSLLLPLNFLERTKTRKRLLTQNPPTAVLHIGRVRFEGPALERVLITSPHAKGASQCYMFASWFQGQWVYPKLPMNYKTAWGWA